MHDVHDQIDDWFTFHPPLSETRRRAHVAVRDGCRDLAHLLADTVPPSNELDSALWYLRQSAMWGNAGLALAPDPDDPAGPGAGRPAVNLLTGPGCPDPCTGPCADPCTGPAPGRAGKATP